jgi:predicted site-specific integrase-resolvase
MSNVNLTLPLLKTAEASALLNISENTLRSWKSRGEGPDVVLVGKRKRAVRYSIESLQKFVEASNEPSK